MKDEQVTRGEQVLGDMEAAFSRQDLEGVVALFTEDASVESYLVTRVFNRKEGVCHGRAEIRELVRALMKRGTPWGGHEPPIVRGNTIAVEYRALSSDTEKFSVDIIEVRDGKIQSLRAYAGWRAVVALTGEARAAFPGSKPYSPIATPAEGSSATPKAGNRAATDSDRSKRTSSLGTSSTPAPPDPKKRPNAE